MRLKVFFGLALLSLAAIVTVTFSNKSYAAGSPLQISVSRPSASCATGVFAGPTTYTFDYNGGSVTLSGVSDGTGNIYTDDQVDIEVTHSDTTKSTFSQDYGSSGTIVQTAPQVVTSYFKTGANTVKITMNNLRTPQCGSSAYWLVETVGGGGGPTKPNILPRSRWHGDNSGVIQSQTANHIVIHHTASTNDPGNISTKYKELFMAWSIDKIGTVQNGFNPVTILNTKGDYSSIRGTWPGEIFLIWLEHKINEGYGDIGYHYLIDPNGVIYEGRYRGGLAENADNKGSNVKKANTGVIGISILGRYGSDGNALANVSDAGIMFPTNATTQSIKSLVDWIAGKYNISKTGEYQIQQSVGDERSCQLAPEQCFVPNIAGHKDFPSKTLTTSTACPGDNLYTLLPTLRGMANMQANGTLPAHTNPTGIIIGGFSPVNLGVVDPTGKRLGVDPSNGQFVNNIPGGYYGKLPMYDTEDDATVPAPFWLHVPTTTNGVYKIDVVGTGTGTFTLTTEDLSTSNARAKNGNTTNGQKDNYQIIYNVSNPGNFEFFHDTVPPVTTGKMTCSRDMQGICRSTATVTLASTDTGTNGDPASGVAKTECSYDNQATWQTCGIPTFTKNEKKSFFYRSVDRVGNVEAAKNSGIIDVQQFVALGDSTLNSAFATTLNTTGISQSNGSMSFIYGTTIHLDILNYITTFTQSGNTTFTYNQKNQITTANPLPNYPLSYYKGICQNITGSLTISDTSPAYNKCIYVIGDVLFQPTAATGKLTIVSEGFITDKGNQATLTAWDTKNGVLFYSAKGYSSIANGADLTGVLYAPTTKVDTSFSNSKIHGGLYSKNVTFGSGTSLDLFQSAGFPTTTYNLPL